MKSKSKSRDRFSDSKRVRARPNKWQIYERLKADLPPTLTSEQHEIACQRIARELGI